MRRLTGALARAGGAWDAVVTAIVVTPRHVRDALAVRRQRWAGLSAAAVVLVVYLFSTGDLDVSPSGRFTGAPVLRTALGQLFKLRAPYLFEPVVAWHPTEHVAVFLSPVNVLLGAIVALLVGCNIAVAGYAARQAASCRRPGSGSGYAWLLGSFPHFCSDSPAAYRRSCLSWAPARQRHSCRC